jgi:Protein tyrosine and serine/threonine kinase
MDEQYIIISNLEARVSPFYLKKTMHHYFFPNVINFSSQDLRPPISENCAPPLRALIEQCWSNVPEKRPDFWQIVKLLEQFDLALARDGSLNGLQNSTSQDHKKWMKNWIQRLRPSNHSDPPGPYSPKFL